MEARETAECKLWGYLYVLKSQRGRGRDLETATALFSSSLHILIKSIQIEIQSCSIWGPIQQGLDYNIMSMEESE